MRSKGKPKRDRLKTGRDLSANVKLLRLDESMVAWFTIDASFQAELILLVTNFSSVVMSASDLVRVLAVGDQQQRSFHRAPSAGRIRVVCAAVSRFTVATVGCCTKFSVCSKSAAGVFARIQ